MYTCHPLAFANHMYRLVLGDGAPGSPKRSEILTRVDPSLNLAIDPVPGRDGDILEDRYVTAVGSYSATAPLNQGAAWIMQMVALRAVGSPPPSP